MLLALSAFLLTRRHTFVQAVGLTNDAMRAAVLQTPVLAWLRGKGRNRRRQEAECNRH